MGKETQQMKFAIITPNMAVAVSGVDEVSGEEMFYAVMDQAYGTVPVLDLDEEDYVDFDSLVDLDKTDEDEGVLYTAPQDMWPVGSRVRVLTDEFETGGQEGLIIGHYYDAYEVTHDGDDEGNFPYTYEAYELELLETPEAQRILIGDTVQVVDTILDSNLVLGLRGSVVSGPDETSDGPRYLVAFKGDHLWTPECTPTNKEGLWWVSEDALEVQ